MTSYRIVHGNTHGLPDVSNFVERLSRLGRSAAPEMHRFFEPNRELFVTRAPGRLDVMGGIADYSGSLVLPMPIQEATFVALQKDRNCTLSTVSLAEDFLPVLAFEMSLSQYGSGESPLTYAAARTYFQSDPSRHWAAYVAGVFLVLHRERGIRFLEGARILISSSVPLGKGVSSSAALEVAVMQAVAAAFDAQIEPRETALLCQMVENLVVGAPCGVMDQMTSACGAAHRLLPILCQPAELQEVITIPKEIGLWGIDSGLQHSISGSDYASVRAGAFMGYRIIAERAGFRPSQTNDGVPLRIEDPRWGGYLANVTPSEFEQHFAAALPKEIYGEEFLDRYGGTTDPLTRIDAERNYPVRIPTAHAVYEHHRVRVFAELLRGRITERQLELLGELMYQSHASYAACGLSVPGTDRLVTLVREAEPALRLYGARITGGGSGGTVAILGADTAGPAIVKLAERYAQDTGCQPQVFAGSSPGSAAFGYLKLSSV